MTTLQEYLNQKYPTKEEREKVRKVNINEIDIERRELDNSLDEDLDSMLGKALEGGELDLREFKQLEEVSVQGSAFRTTLTKIDVSSCVNLVELNISNNSLTSADFLKQLPHPEKLERLFIYNNNIRTTNICLFEPFINLRELRIGTEETVLREGNRNQFYGSFKS